MPPSSPSIGCTIFRSLSNTRTHWQQHATLPSVPHWAQQMHIFLREDMGEYETARVLLGGLLASGAVKDPHETRFLIERLSS